MGKIGTSMFSMSIRRWAKSRSKNSPLYQRFFRRIHFPGTSSPRPWNWVWDGWAILTAISHSLHSTSTRTSSPTSAWSRVTIVAQVRADIRRWHWRSSNWNGGKKEWPQQVRTPTTWTDSPSSTQWATETLAAKGPVKNVILQFTFSHDHSRYDPIWNPGFWRGWKPHYAPLYCKKILK